MTTSTATAPPNTPSPPRSRAATVLRILGWTLIGAGGVVLLYLVYSLFFTNLETSAAQSDLAERWSLQVGSIGDSAPADAPSPPEREQDEQADPAQVDQSGAMAVLQFHRQGADEPPVQADPLFVVSGVTRADLTRGPGHYPGTAMPGEEGNFAIAGHRTTYGAPFFHLDQLEAGDEIHVTSRDGRRYVYQVRELRVVGPADTWVLGPDPLESGGAMLTLTTCHPRFSAAQRLVAFAELVA